MRRGRHRAGQHLRIRVDVARVGWRAPTVLVSREHRDVELRDSVHPTRRRDTCNRRRAGARRMARRRIPVHRRVVGARCVARQSRGPAGAWRSRRLARHRRAACEVSIDESRRDCRRRSHAGRRLVRSQPACCRDCAGRRARSASNTSTIASWASITMRRSRAFAAARIACRDRGRLRRQRRRRCGLSKSRRWWACRFPSNRCAASSTTSKRQTGSNRCLTSRIRRASLSGRRGAAIPADSSIPTSRAATTSRSITIISRRVVWPALAHRFLHSRRVAAGARGRGSMSRT